MRILSLLLLFFILTASTQAQRFAYVDTDYVLANLPDYSAARKQLDELAVKWQEEIEAKLAEVDKMYRDYQVEKILLSEEMRIQRENEIIQKEKEVKDLQKKRFGKDGDLFTKQEELIRPIQDKVYNAIKEISENKGYAMVFDKAGTTTVIFSSERYDISNDVIRELGHEPGALPKEEDSEGTEEEPEDMEDTQD